jgi:hypothetical protein
VTYNTGLRVEVLTQTGVRDQASPATTTTQSLN